MEFFKRVDALIFSFEEERKSEENKRMKAETLFDSLVQKAKANKVSLVVSTKDHAIKFSYRSEIFLALDKDPNGKWEWENTVWSVEECKKSWLSNTRGRVMIVLASALENKAEIEIVKE